MTGEGDLRWLGRGSSDNRGGGAQMTGGISDDRGGSQMTGEGISDDRGGDLR